MDIKRAVIKPFMNMAGSETGHRDNYAVAQNKQKPRWLRLVLSGNTNDDISDKYVDVYSWISLALSH